MYQGPIVLDRTTPDAKWFWINWDMDGAWDSGVEPEREHIWQQENGIYNVMMNPERDRDNPKTARYQNEDARPILFRRLHHEDPLFRQYFERLFTDVMNHKLTPDYLEHWFQRRSQEILAIHPETKPFLEEKLHPFITHRADYLRELMQTYFGAAQSVACTVEGMEDTKARIDGFDHAGNYTGWYFKGATITITLTDDKANTGRMVVAAAGSPTLTHTVEAATTIRPVFSFAR